MAILEERLLEYNMEVQREQKTQVSSQTCPSGKDHPAVCGECQKIPKDKNLSDPSVSALAKENCFTKGHCIPEQRL